MPRSIHAALTLAAVLGGSSAALAQDEESGWFEGEEETAEEAPETDAVPVEAPPPPPAAKTKAPAPAKPKAVEPTEEDHSGCRWHGKHHRHWKQPKGSRSLSLVLGKARFDAPELADALERSGFDHDGSELRFVALQGTRVLPSRLVLGLGGTFGWSDRLEREDGTGGRMTLMQLRGQIGWALVHTEKWLLYPALEIAGSRLEIDLGAPGSGSFDDALASPRTGTELVRHSLAAGGVAAIERRFPIRRKSSRDETRFFSIGLRAGIHRDLVASPWRVDGDGDARGPEEHATTKYVGITLGFGTARF
jgi:hypothetical protein